MTSLDPENLSSPLTDTGRKDSLSLNVEFVKVNISRSRKGIFQGETSTTQSSAKLSTLPDGQTKAANIVRFSGKKISKKLFTCALLWWI